MTTLADNMRAIRPWQILVLVVAPFIVAGMVYGAYTVATRDADDDLAEDQQLIPVQRGDLVNDVSISGSLAYSEREILMFGSQGTLGRIEVEEGQTVAANEVLATLDAASIGSLEKAVAEAEVELQDAQGALDALEEPPTPLEVANAELKVANAMLGLTEAVEDVDTLREPTASDIAKAEAAVANAELDLEKALETVAALRKPTASDIAKAEAAVAAARLSLQQAADAVSDFMAPTPLEIEAAAAKVADARVAVDAAQTKLDTLRESPTPDDMAKAQSQVEAAEANLAIAQTDLDLAQTEWARKIDDAEEALEDAVDDYRAVITKWLGMDLADEDLDADLDDLFERHGIDLEAIFDPALRGRVTDSSSLYFYVGPPADDPATAWNETTVHAWLNLWPSTLLPTCDNRTVPERGACVREEIETASEGYGDARDSLETNVMQSDRSVTAAQSKLTTADESLASAEENLAQVQAGTDPLDIEAQESKLALAIATLMSAQDELQTLTAGPDPTALAAKQSDILVASAEVEDAEEALAALLSGPNPIDLDAKERQVNVARADLDDAEEALAALLSGPNPVDLDAKERQVAVARASLDEATEELSAVAAGPDPLEVALGEAEIAAAQSDLEDALENLAAATLRSPMAGIVSEIRAEVGQQVTLTTPILEILDPTVVEVQGSVDEIDVLFVTVGDTASITLDALPGQALTGTVSEIAATATSQQGVVTYPLSIRVEIPAGTELPEGLTAVASVIIREDRNVLLVPLDALQGTFQQPTLRVKTVDGIVERPVTLGNSDDFWIVVTEGVTENESVVLEVRDAYTFGFGGGFGAFRQLGGGFSGRGGGSRR